MSNVLEPRSDITGTDSAFMNILESKMSSYSHGFATALFSFLYHLASYEAGNIKSSSSFNNALATTCFLNKERE